MFDIERWEEIFDTIRKNKLRTFLTGLSVGSGIFILVVLLGVGKGMENGVGNEFSKDATNLIWVWTDPTSMAYNGQNPGRDIQLNNQDFDFTMRKYDDVLEYKSKMLRQRGQLISNGKESGSYRVEGVVPDFQFVETCHMIAGRFISPKDIDTYQKVAVIGYRVQKDLFKNDENPIGKYVDLNGIMFKIIGVYTDPGGEREETRAYIPFSTAQRMFDRNNKVGDMAFTLKPQETFEASVAAANQLTEQLKTDLKKRHNIHPDDTSGIGIFNKQEELKRYFDLMKMIRLFFWVVGVFTIIAGIVGVSNIMLIIVKERTKEIGVRKALGATPRAIVSMIVQESVFLTSIAGYIGLASGLLVIHGIDSFMKANDIEAEFFYNPSVDIGAVSFALFILILSGVVAGLIPALQAVKINPVIAMKG